MSSSPTSQFAWSNREQDELMKQTKREALQKCDDVVKGELLLLISIDENESAKVRYER